MRKAVRAAAIAAGVAVLFLLFGSLFIDTSVESEGWYLLAYFAALLVGFPTSLLFRELSLAVGNGEVLSPMLAMLLGWPVNWFLLTLAFQSRTGRSSTSTSAR